MAKNHKLNIAIALCVLLLGVYLVVPVAASMKASDIIMSHSCKATAKGNGKIAVTFSITAKYPVSQIGAKSMYFFANDNGNWTFEESFDKEDTDMVRNNKGIHGGTIFYQGTSGVRYKVVVTLFAEDSDGTSDARTYTMYVTA